MNNNCVFGCSHVCTVVTTNCDMAGIVASLKLGLVRDLATLVTKPLDCKEGGGGGSNHLLVTICIGKIFPKGRVQQSSIPQWCDQQNGSWMS